MRYGKSSFIVTVYVILIRVYFSALIIDTLAIFGPATPTKHGWSPQYPYRVLAITPIIPKIHAVFPFLGVITARGVGRNFRRGFPLTVDPRCGGLGAVPPEAEGYFKTLWSNFAAFCNV